MVAYFCPAPAVAIGRTAAAEFARLGALTREWALLREQLTSPTDLRAALLNPEAVLHPEFPFLWRLDESNCVEGVIDLALFDQHAGRWLVIDWKTNRVQPNEVDILREQYRPQLAAYWKAVSEMTHLPVEAAIYSTPTGALLRYSEDELETSGNDSRLGIARAGDEFFDASIRLVVRHLLRRMFRKISGRGMQHATFAAIQRKFTAANGVDCHTGRVR